MTNSQDPAFVHASTSSSPKTIPDGIIEIKDPEIDVQQIMHQIRENMVVRKAQLPAFRSMMLAEDRLALRAAQESLRAFSKSYGTIDGKGPGLKNRILFFIKRVVRKLFHRHLEQGRDIHEAMLKLTERLIATMDQHLEHNSELLSKIDKLEKKLAEYQK